MTRLLLRCGLEPCSIVRSQRKRPCAVSHQPGVTKVGRVWVATSADVVAKPTLRMRIGSGKASLAINNGPTMTVELVRHDAGTGLEMGWYYPITSCRV